MALQRVGELVRRRFVAAATNDEAPTYGLNRVNAYFTSTKELIRHFWDGRFSYVKEDFVFPIGCAAPVFFGLYFYGNSELGYAPYKQFKSTS